jgi:hypothetical protein
MKSWVIIVLSAFALAGGALAAEPAKHKSEAANVKPLTYANVISFFKSAELCATAVQQRCTVFSEGTWNNGNLYNYCLIIVENSDEDVQVTFYLTDAHEMNWVTEFLDAPFFARGETEKLFGLMNSNHDVRGEKVGRFRVDFHRWQPRHAEILVFSFVGVQPGHG